MLSAAWNWTFSFNLYLSEGQRLFWEVLLSSFLNQSDQTAMRGRQKGITTPGVLVVLSAPCGLGACCPLSIAGCAELPWRYLSCSTCRAPIPQLLGTVLGRDAGGCHRTGGGCSLCAPEKKCNCTPGPWGAQQEGGVAHW